VERAVTATELPFWQLVRADVQATTHANFKLYSDTRFWLRAMAKLVVSPNVRAVLTYRIAHELAKKRLLPLALLLRSRAIRTSGAELNPLARIGPGLYLVHSIGVGIGAYVVIGANCKIHLGVVIGPQPLEQSGPKYTVIGDDVFIGTHAVIIGGVTIGDGAVIGANAVVMRDVAPYTVVSAPPARTVWQRSQDDAQPG
jgi:serine O-acetyltransferase